MDVLQFIVEGQRDGLVLQLLALVCVDLGSGCLFIFGQVPDLVFGALDVFLEGGS